MTPLTHVLYAAGWFVLGAIVGAQWTWMRRTVRQLANAQAEEDQVSSPEEPRTPRRRWPRLVLDTFVVALFILSAVQAYITNQQITSVVECQNGYQAGFADALDARSAATSSAQDALDELMSTVGQLTTTGTPETRAKFRDALQKYLDKRAEAKKKQQENPFPPSPRDLCK